MKIEKELKCSSHVLAIAAKMSARVRLYPNHVSKSQKKHKKRAKSRSQTKAYFWYRCNDSTFYNAISTLMQHTQYLFPASKQHFISTCTIEHTGLTKRKRSYHSRNTNAMKLFAVLRHINAVRRMWHNQTETKWLTPSPTHTWSHNKILTRTIHPKYFTSKLESFQA